MSPRGGSRRIAAQRSARLGGIELPLASGLLDDVAAAQHGEYLRLRAELAPLPPAAERSKQAETPWQNEIRLLCRQLGIYTYHPYLSRFSQRGWPDLSLLDEARHRASWIEVKRDDGQLTEEQVRVIVAMRACGLRVEVFRPWHGLQAVADWLTR